MGVGKTVIGSAIAESLGRPVFDSDRRLEASGGDTGQVIAAKIGVDGLHQHEHGFLRDAINSTGPAVIAAAASCADDRDLLNTVVAAGHALVFLDAANIDLTQLARGASHRRPVPESEAIRLHSRRRATAEAAGALVFTPRRFSDPEQAASALLDELSLLDR